MDENVVISVENVSKAYRIWNSPASRLISPAWASAGRFFGEDSATGKAFRARANRQYRDFWALRAVNFELLRGESIGIIGRNGSGKSTLLQIIAGTLQPTSGSIQVNGRVAALLELGSGFNPEFTGRENVYLNGAILGLTKRDIDERFDGIASFADIGDFIEQPVKTYSSGMFIRLAFAVQTAVEPKVLLVDEALSVGDVFFQQRCYQRMSQLLDTGVCVVLASHDLGSVQKFCKNTLVFKRGEVMFFGESAAATMFYFQMEQKEKVASFEAAPPSAPLVDDATSPAQLPISQWPARESGVPISDATAIGNGWAVCRFVALCEDGKPTLNFRQGQTLSVFYEFEILRDMEFCIGCVTIRDKSAQAVHSKITLQDGIRWPSHVKAGSSLRFRQDAVLNISCADYTLQVSLDMVNSALLSQTGISYEEYMSAQVRVCEVSSLASFKVRLREETTPFQLLHFGTAGLPSSSSVELLEPGFR